jgi:hypothetical protein
MKKLRGEKICVLMVTLALSVGAVGFAAPDSPSRWDFRLALGTAGIEYESPTINNRFETYGDNMTRMILALDGLAEYSLSTPVHLVLGMATTFDLNFGSGKHQHYFDYGLLAGFRYIPFPPWLSFEVEYVAGQRYDFISLDDSHDGIFYTPWGNGFRIGAECMLGYLTYHIVPIAGVNWRWMPRVPVGMDAQTDKIFTVYLAFRYQKDVLTRVNRR